MFENWNFEARGRIPEMGSGPGGSLTKRDTVVASGVASVVGGALFYLVDRENTPSVSSDTERYNLSTETMPNLSEGDGITVVQTQENIPTQESISQGAIASVLAGVGILLICIGTRIKRAPNETL